MEKTKDKNKRSTWLLPIQQIILKIMAFLMGKKAVEEEVIELLREIELEYFILLDKLKATEIRANIDQKTGLLIYKPEYLKDIVQTATRYQDAKKVSDIFSVTYIRLDIDDFSLLNNTYGHGAGDEILITVANIIKKSIKPTDYAIRFGGEEFDIILPYTNEYGGKIVAKKLLQNIKKLKFNFDKEEIRITVSMGVATHERSLSGYYNRLRNMDFFWQNLNNIQVKADCACYDAKNSGKDCFKFFSPENDYKSIRKEYASKAYKNSQENN
jgi:diguanylate cyclase (GGDEF)-like protein